MANRGQIHWFQKSMFFVNSIFKNGVSYLTKYSLIMIDLYHKSNHKINIPDFWGPCRVCFGPDHFLLTSHFNSDLFLGLMIRSNGNLYIYKASNAFQCSQISQQDVYGQIGCLCLNAGNWDLPAVLPVTKCDDYLQWYELTPTQHGTYHLLPLTSTHPAPQ